MMQKLIEFLLIFVSCIAISEANINLPGPVGYVSDYANVIDSESREKISSLISELEQKTGAEIAVVTIKTLESNSIDDYSVRLFEKFGIGKKDKNNGVLILAAIEDRKVRIEVGYGLEGILPDGLCGEIIDKYVIPGFKQGDYGKGLMTGVFVVASFIAKDANVEFTGTAVPAVDEPRKASTGKMIFNIIFIIVLIIIFIRHPFLFLLFMGGGGRGSSGGFGGGFGGGGFGGGMSGGGGASRGW